MPLKNQLSAKQELQIGDAVRLKIRSDTTHFHYNNVKQVRGVVNEISSVVLPNYNGALISVYTGREVFDKEHRLIFENFTVAAEDLDLSESVITRMYGDVPVNFEIRLGRALLYGLVQTSVYQAEGKMSSAVLEARVKLEKAISSPLEVAERYLPWAYSLLKEAYDYDSSAILEFLGENLLITNSSGVKQSVLESFSPRKNLENKSAQETLLRQFWLFLQQKGIAADPISEDLWLTSERDGHRYKVSKGDWVSLVYNFPTGDNAGPQGVVTRLDPSKKQLVISNRFGANFDTIDRRHSLIRFRSDQVPWQKFEDVADVISATLEWPAMSITPRLGVEQFRHYLSPGIAIHHHHLREVIRWLRLAFSNDDLIPYGRVLLESFYVYENSQWLSFLEKFNFADSQIAVPLRIIHELEILIRHKAPLSH